MKFSTINQLWADLMVKELVRNGVNYFCVSPGSRSAPLTIAVANNKRAKSFVHFDERGSAFYALGIAAAISQPVCVLTTSGTAAANLFPAIIEASKKKLPLIVLTADRPPELRHTGANQTIDQVKIFGDYVRWYFDLPTPTTEIPAEFVLTTVDQALHRSQGELKGPVHINCMYREPLVSLGGKINLTEYVKSIRSWLKGTRPFTQYVRPRIKLPEEQIQDVVGAINKIKSGIIVAGKLATKQDREGALRLSEKLNWPIFPDVTSGLRLGCDHKNVIAYFDQLLLSGNILKRLKCDSVIHLGGRITSKRWYQYVEKNKPANYIMALNHPLRNDPLHGVTLRVQSSVAEFCQTLIPQLRKQHSKNILNYLQAANNKAAARIEKLLKNTDQLKEFSVARLITQHIPKDSALFISNSLPIREIDMYGDAAGESVTVAANRGASGIDGIIASAAGFAQGSNKATTLLIGDLAFLHDLNSLALLRTLYKPFVVVVLNNNGGGIFEFLPVAKIKNAFEKYFATPQDFQCRHAAQLFGLNYSLPRSQSEFIIAYRQAFQKPGSTIIEVQTSRKEIVQISQQFQKALR